MCRYVQSLLVTSIRNQADGDILAADGTMVLMFPSRSPPLGLMVMSG